MKDANENGTVDATLDSAAVRARPPLRVLYEELNAHVWGGQLVPTWPRGFYGSHPRAVCVYRFSGLWVRVPVPAGTRHYAVGVFWPPTTYMPARILLSQMARSREREVLLHEMVHCYLHFAGLDDNHGPRFMAELERLGGLGEAWALEQAAAYRKRTAKQSAKAFTDMVASVERRRG